MLDLQIQHVLKRNVVWFFFLSNKQTIAAVIRTEELSYIIKNA